MIPFLSKAAALGYRAVEIGGKRPHLSPLDYRERAKLDAIRTEAERLKLEIATIAGYTDFTAGRTFPTFHFWKCNWPTSASCHASPRALGAKFVRVFSGYSPATESFQSDWRKCVRRLACGRRSCRGTRRHARPAESSRRGDRGRSIRRAARRDRPSVFESDFDPWSVALTGGDLRKSAERLAPRMVQTTLADYVRLERFAYDPAIINYHRLEPPALRAVPLGEGFLDLPAFFAGLRTGEVHGLRSLRDVLTTARRRQSGKTWMPRLQRAWHTFVD